MKIKALKTYHVYFIGPYMYAYVKLMRAYILDSGEPE